MDPKNLNSFSNSQHPENFETPVIQESKSRPGGTKDLPDSIQSTNTTHSTHSTDSKHSPHNKLYKLLKLERLSTAFFYLSILLFIIGFNFSDVMVGNWYQQFMPNIVPSPITDITFVDSLIGYAVTNYQAPNDTDYILKSTNGGNNWSIVRMDSQQFAGFNRIWFLNKDTGYTCGVSNFPTNTSIQKTINGGQNWINVNPPDVSATYSDMSVLNNDTIWLTDESSLGGGVFFTSNGGVNWQPQYSAGALNPDKIYMYNARIGFISNSSGSNFRKTTNGGQNWVQLNDTGFTDIHFIDSLTGWKAFGNMKKTTDGGLNWTSQVIPFGGQITISSMRKFSVINKDTLWGVGSVLWYGGMNYRGIILRTTNGGLNWGFQIPDTTVYYYQILHSKFVNKLNGWVYLPGLSPITSVNGFHTNTGGDTTFILPVKQISSEIPEEFRLEQNYPNPFNPKTIIRFHVKRSSNVEIRVYDVAGKEVVTLLDEQKSPGTYEVDFTGYTYSSGIYFYSLIADGKLISTRKMILVK